MASSPENQPSKERASSLEDLQYRLHSRTPPPVLRDKEFFREERHLRITPSWTNETAERRSAFYSLLTSTMPWLKRLLIVSVIFFFFAAGLAFYGFWRGGNTISPQNISVEVQGPVGGGAGEEMSLDIHISNENPLSLESVDLLVEFPESTRAPDALSEPLLRYRDSLGALSAGERILRTISFVPFGEEGETQTILITAEYRPKDSNAIFSREIEYEFTLSSAPVHFTLDLPKEVNADQTFEMLLELTSNSSVVQENLMVEAKYPFGFQFEESSPNPTFGKDIWLLGDIEPQGKRSIRIRGNIRATEEAERSFRFSTGTQSPKDEKQIGTVFSKETAAVSIQKPFITLDLLVNGEKGETFVVRSGQVARADVAWESNLDSKITDLEITATLLGDIYNTASVESSGGFYDSNVNTIRWDKQTSPRFAVVEGGERATESFSLGLLSVATDPGAFKNPSMTIEVSARGKRLDERGASERVELTIKKEIKIATVLTLSSRLSYNDGPFSSTGPIPPRVGEATTYTVTWSLSNTSNGVANTKVSAVLPSYVTWLGEISPVSEELSYKALGGELVWNAGEAEAGEGVGSPPREVSFQISILPSLSQVGTSPTLIGEAAARGTDRFTGVEVKSNARQALSTASLSDPGTSPKSGIVTK
ncbi:MAG: hypothetical protein A2849_00690 [Candidatus Taylorbacteria bacterium RIFCSPHIGHO2_01_FULL_51_15]|uniref:DUF11 domain-containing protein n=1 Tax=Candidatus Taylorbacteria bacterium RIFCSPHIGHO2_01_FULL_51_15 TaxID=1802304 RepID=A0A1G2M9H2_9BACT|nr:MAG: hypothetical protein A2849_00690 [Candidatus Taylorbacteria bacterium RIFCSPHIGHO2_01_FULL_51_15]